MRGSGQRLPITLRFTRVLGTFSHTTCFPFSCALWACFSDRSVSGERSEPMGAPMPHAALWVVQLYGERRITMLSRSFNAARGFVGGAAANLWDALGAGRPFQCRTRLCGWCSEQRIQASWSRFDVSMPHAALRVVQRIGRETLSLMTNCFNAARGFVGGAAIDLLRSVY